MSKLGLETGSRIVKDDNETHSDLNLTPTPSYIIVSLCHITSNRRQRGFNRLNFMFNVEVKMR